MDEKKYDLTEKVTKQTELQDTSEQTGTIDLREKAYEDAKLGVKDFEKDHPGTIRKVTCTTVIGLAATLILDAVIVATA